MNMRPLLALVALSFALPAFSTYADNDPPKFYRELQAKAPEVLEIQFLSIRLESTSNLGPGESLNPQPFAQTVKATAKVLKVKRTATGLKPGDTIRVEYDSVPPRPGRTSPAAIPIFKEGAVRPAWMKILGSGNDALYEPVAGAYSFAEVPAQLPAGLEGQK